MISQLLNASVAHCLDQKQASVSVRRFIVDDRLCVTILTKSGGVALARYGLPGGAKLFPVSSREVRLLVSRLARGVSMGYLLLFLYGAVTAASLAFFIFLLFV